MRFLVDECLPARLAHLLRERGHDATHATECSLAGKSDEQVMGTAADEDRILLSADTDFGEMLVVGRVVAPSVILFRRMGGRPDELAWLLTNNIGAVSDELRNGALVVITADKIRVRRLPVR